MVAALGVDPAVGVSAASAAELLDIHGPNELRKAKRRSALSILLDQFRDLLVALLAAAALLSAVFGDWPEAVAILAVLVINAAIGFITEVQAVRSVEALQRLGSSTTTVRRDGRLHKVAVAEVVPGDVLVVEGGDSVPADARVVEAHDLQVDESTLTGESLPVPKGTEAVVADALIHDRSNMLFRGSAVTSGSAAAVVTATGMNTELGRVSDLVDEAAPESSPLEQRLDDLAKRLAWVTAVTAAVVTVTGVGSGRDWVVLLQTAIALAVATVPEGLPIISTLTLARGVKRMAARDALVNNLPAVETLGATSVIFTDKTGTLTENRMSVARLWLPAGELEHDGSRSAPFRTGDGAPGEAEWTLLLAALEVATLCSNADLPTAAAPSEAGVGDPMELALLRAAQAAGIEREDALARHPEVAEHAFDSATKMMATAHRSESASAGSIGPGSDGAFLIAVKGAPESVLAASSHVAASAPGGPDLPLDDEQRELWLRRNAELAAEGLRVLALARRHAATLAVADSQKPDPYHDLTLLGLVALRDPPRNDVRAAIEAAREAGIRVVMVTGDQAVTARSIASAVALSPHEPTIASGSEVAEMLSDEAGRTALLEVDILARVSPEQKLRIIELHQQSGAIVAMTGDGVNDAPALKQADIGVAMGLRGTDVAREAADMVLKDDAFKTIVEAVREGRVIFGNIRAFVVYLLSCNLSEIGVIGLAGVAGYPLPLLPLQLLFINLVTDVFPALALGTGEGDETVLRRPPRDASEPIVARHHWQSIVGYAALLGGCVLGSFVIALEAFQMTEAQAVTVAFLALAWAQVWHVLNMRDPGSGLIRNAVTTNVWVWAAVTLCTGILVLVMAWAPLRDILSLELLDATGWLLVAAAGLMPAFLGQIGKAFGLGKIS